jgi:hypothetical protein
MIGAQWMKHSPRVKFKDAFSGPHTARSDGWINLKHYYIPSFITLVENMFDKKEMIKEDDSMKK